MGRCLPENPTGEAWTGLPARALWLQSPRSEPTRGNPDVGADSRIDSRMWPRGTEVSGALRDSCLLTCSERHVSPGLWSAVHITRLFVPFYSARHCRPKASPEALFPAQGALCRSANAPSLPSQQRHTTPASGSVAPEPRTAPHPEAASPSSLLALPQLGLTASLPCGKGLLPGPAKEPPA